MVDDIEAHLTDTKSFGQTNHDRGYIEAEDPVHDMWLRLTIDEKMHIQAVEAVSDKTPYAVCPAAAPNFSKLAGLQIKAGFLRDVTHRVGGTAGCTHLRELLQQMATTAFQTINPAKVRRDMPAELEKRGSDVLDILQENPVAKFDRARRLDDADVDVPRAGDHWEQDSEFVFGV